jgi:DNA-binding CsgD family transcriptional regulator
MTAELNMKWSAWERTVLGLWAYRKKEDMVMPNGQAGRVGDPAVMLSVIEKSRLSASADVVKSRLLIVNWCHLLLPRPFGAMTRAQLSPRMRQTLRHLLDGDQEKEIARHLKLSQNTVHVYVKSIYRKYNVSCRAELLSKFLRPLAGEDLPDDEAAQPVRQTRRTSPSAIRRVGRDTPRSNRPNG